MNSRTSGASETFPSLSNGIGADGLGLRQFESSLDRIVSGNRLQERTEPDTHTVAYNSRFQFFHTKRASIINDSSVNDLATREDSLVKAWRTVSEIDALLGSDFRPSMSTYEEERPSAVDEAYVKRLNGELEAAMNVSLTFKERYRAGRAGSRHVGNGGGGWLGISGGPGSSAVPAAAAVMAPAVPGHGHGHGATTMAMAMENGIGPKEPQVGAVGGGGGVAAEPSGLSTPRPPAAPGGPLFSSPFLVRQRYSDASGSFSPSSLPYQHQYQHNAQQPYGMAPSSPRMSTQMTTSSAGGVTTAAVPSLTGATASASVPTFSGGGIGGPAAAALATTGVGTGGNGGKALSLHPSVHIPVPPASPGPPPSPRSVQMCAAASTSTSAGSTTAGASAPPPPPSALGPVALALPATSRRLHGGIIRVAVGSALDHGVWDSDGVWRPAEPTHEVYIPEDLQRINPDDLVKVRELGRGCFGSVWLARWRGVDVALKELLNQTALDGPPNEVFYEAERLASLRHPCVIAFYGIVTSPGCYATVVEYMRMGSLKSGLTRLRRQGADISRRLRAAIALQAARGMEYLHSQYLVHFDLKCDNLLCDLRDPFRPVVKIGDLGLSKKKKDSFVSGNMRGTLPWMAPELFPGVRERQRLEAAAAAAPVAVAAGNGEVCGDGIASAASAGPVIGGGDGGDGSTIPCAAAAATTACSTTTNGNVDCLDDRVNEKVDVFSFGIVLWEIWKLGEQPYSSYSLADIFAGVMTGSLRPAVPSDCDPDWAALMQACWHGNPRSRPSFSEVAERLEATLERLTSQEAATATTTTANNGNVSGGSGGGVAPALASRRI